jgi:hypothetical protein
MNSGLLAITESDVDYPLLAKFRAELCFLPASHKSVVLERRDLVPLQLLTPYFLVSLLK